MLRTDDEVRTIRPGRRVLCQEQGAYKGKRGRVLDVFAGQAKVRFSEDGDATSTVFKPVEYFEPILQ